LGEERDGESKVSKKKTKRNGRNRKRKDTEAVCPSKFLVCIPLLAYIPSE